MLIASLEDTQRGAIFACVTLSQEATTPDKHGACLAASISEHRVVAAPASWRHGPHNEYFEGSDSTVHTVLSGAVSASYPDPARATGPQTGYTPKGPYGSASTLHAPPSDPARRKHA